MADFTITLGNKNYSSWSLRGWLALKQTGVAFEEQTIPLRRDDTRQQILAHSPSGKVPVLQEGAVVVWDSLAIAEYLADRFPKAGLWPEDIAARAHARAISAEMHSGFAALRTYLPMDMRLHDDVLGKRLAALPEVAADIARISALWEDCRTRFGRGGDFLFGGFSTADAMYAPVVSRFTTYGVRLSEKAERYREAVMAWPAMTEWEAAAREEPWTIAYPARDQLAADRPFRAE